VQLAVKREVYDSVTPQKQLVMKLTCRLCNAQLYIDHSIQCAVAKIINY